MIQLSVGVALVSMPQTAVPLQPLGLQPSGSGPFPWLCIPTHRLCGGSASRRSGCVQHKERLCGSVNTGPPFHQGR